MRNKKWWISFLEKSNKMKANWMWFCGEMLDGHPQPPLYSDFFFKVWPKDKLFKYFKENMAPHIAKAMIEDYTNFQIDKDTWIFSLHKDDGNMFLWSHESTFPLIIKNITDPILKKLVSGMAILEFRKASDGLQWEDRDAYYDTQEVIREWEEWGKW